MKNLKEERSRILTKKYIIHSKPFIFLKTFLFLLIEEPFIVNYSSQIRSDKHIHEMNKMLPLFLLYMHS